MNIINFKKYLLDNNLPKYMYILKYEDNTFLAHQYINRIASNLNKNIEYINDINSISIINDLTTDDNLYVYITDKLEDYINNPSLIIICKSIKREIEEKLINNIIELPKLINWQIKNYVKTQLPRLDINKLDWLCNITNYDIYRLNNEINKIKLFTSASNNMIFDELNSDDNYNDLSIFTIFDLSNAILKKDINKLNNVLNEINNLNIDPIPLINILEKNFINILNLQTNPKITANDLNLNYKQFLAMKYNCNIYTNNQLFKILKFLTSIDQLIKEGKIDYNILIDYIIVNIIGV